MKFDNKGCDIVDKRFEKFISNFQLVDLLGFATLLGVEERDNFEDFKNDIAAALDGVEKKRKKELLRLAKDISLANLEIEKQKKKLR